MGCNKFIIVLFEVIDEKDLRPLTLAEIHVGFVFYRKDPDGYHHCVCGEGDAKDAMWKALTKMYVKEGRLFTRTSKPGYGFAK